MAITLSEKPDLKSAPKTTCNKVSWDGKLNTLIISILLIADEGATLNPSVKSETNEIRLAARLCRNLPEQSLTDASKRAFVAAWLTDLLRRDEETERAYWLDIQAQQRRIQFWVRNLKRPERSLFFLQKADGRFYADFLCQLPGKDDKSGPIFAVPYKGADRWSSAENNRLVGGLWANLSEGRCRFVMVKDKHRDEIEPLLA